jgi:hypothetical protein
MARAKVRVRYSNDMRRLLLPSAITTVLAIAEAASAAKIPFSFAPNVAANPTRTQQKLAALDAKLPASFALPASFVSLTSNAPAGTVQLSFEPETARALERARTAGPGTMTWPGGTPALCTKHAAFSVPTALLAQPASQACVTVAAALREKLAAVATCREVEQPERYVLGLKPAVVNDSTTATIESLVGLAGETLSHYPPQAGLLPDDFVTKLRSVVWKIRKAPIDAQILAARASYKDVLTTLEAQKGCFDPSARAAFVLAVSDLDAELAAATAHVANLDAAGRAAAQQDQVCLGARGRTRGALPLPALTDAERRFVAFWLGGIYWRFRGGGMIPLGSTQAARMQFLERPFRRIGEMTGGTPGEEASFRIFLNIFSGWGEWMDMGTTPGGQDLYEDLVQMTDRGRQQVQDPATSAAGLPISIPISGLEGAAVYLADKGYDATALLAGGLEMGPCYAYALTPLRDFRYADTPMAPYNGTFIEGFTAMGEFCTGASIALGLANTLLDGTKGSAPATPLCTGKQCGDDGCGGSCGTCAGGLACQAGACVACAPSCEGKACGDVDGCGGACDVGCADAGAGPRAAPAAAMVDGEGARGDAGCTCRAAPERDGTGAAAAGSALALALATALRARRAARNARSARDSVR